MGIAQNHFLFHARDGRALKLFIREDVWEGRHDYDLGGWIAHEMFQEGITEDELDLEALAEELGGALCVARPDWYDMRDARGLANSLGMGEPAKLLRAKAPEDRDWFVPGLIARGGVTLIGGREKLSGKSTLVFNIVGALERGEPTMFGPAYEQKVRTLIITEEPEYAIVDKLNRFDLQEAWIVQDWAWPLERVEGYTLQEKWKEKLVQVEKLAAATECAHVVIDPLSRIAQVEDEAGRELGMRAEAVSSFAYRSMLAVTVIHHQNKRSDAASEDRFRGSTSLTAAVDQMVSIEKRSRKKDKARIRHAVSYGRVEEVNWERAWELQEDGTTYRLIDFQSDAIPEEVADLLVLRGLPNQRGTVAMFCEAMTLDPQVSSEYQKGRRRLESLIESGLAEKEGTGQSRVYIAREAE